MLVMLFLLVFCSLSGYVHAYLEAVTGTERSGTVLAVPHPETWMSIAYREIALSTLHDSETIEGAYKEGQNLLYSLRHDGPLPAERELTLEALKMFDEVMRVDPIVLLPASPNWAVGFLSGFIQSYVEGEQQTEPLSTLAKEEA
jgi:hypothetical protein